MSCAALGLKGSRVSLTVACRMFMGSMRVRESGSWCVSDFSAATSRRLPPPCTQSLPGPMERHRNISSTSSSDISTSSDDETHPADAPNPLTSPNSRRVTAHPNISRLTHRPSISSSTSTSVSKSTQISRIETPAFGRCIITNKITSNRLFPKRPKDSQKVLAYKSSTRPAY